MAARWEAHTKPGQLRSTSLFSRLAGHLRTIHANCNLEPSYQIDRSEPLYEHEPAASNARVRHWVTPSELATCLEQCRPKLKNPQHEQEKAQVLSNSAVLQQDSVTNLQPLASHVPPNIPWDTLDAGQVVDRSQADGGLLAISQSLLDPDFTIMDRIVSFDEMMLGNISETWDLG